MNTLSIVHDFLRRTVRPGSLCIDATAGKGRDTALLCELELELKQGSEEALSAFARALMDTYHLSEQPLSKLQRARALAE